MIEFDATLVVQMFNFAIFLFILRKILFTPLVNHIQERRNYISSSEKKIADGLVKLEAAEKNYHEQLDNARKNAQDIINKNISMAEEEKQKIVKAAIEETRKVFDDFRNELNAEAAKAKTELESEVIALATEIAKKVMSTNLDERVLVQEGSH